MTHVFISYKREEGARVGRLVLALEKAGLDVWWDRGLQAGEQWRAITQAALDAAGCVVVVWTEASVGPQGGGFVKDEATRGLARKILVPVLMDRVQPPLGFGELQAIDLVAWRGSVRDASFNDLLLAIKAKLTGRPPPPARATLKRLARRLTLGSVASAITVAGVAFATNAVNLQDKACAMPLGQPAISDACGDWGLGGRPAKAERIAWQQRAPGDCKALRAHVGQFPSGAYRAKAEALVSAKTVITSEQVVPGERKLNLYVGADAAPSRSEDAARAAALQRGANDAQQQCRDFASAGRLFEYRSARVLPDKWACNRQGGGWVCALHGQAVCDLGERQQVAVERCDDMAAATAR